MNLPYDLDAERNVVTAMMLSAEHTATALRVIGPHDFYDQGHARVVDAIERMHLDGKHPKGNAVVVADAIGGHPSAADLLDLMGGGGFWSPMAADIVLRHSMARRLLRASEQITADAQASVLPADELLDKATATLSGIDAPPTSDARLDGLLTFKQFTDRADATPQPWVVPGLLRRGWRCVLVASEGSGKTVVMRTLAGAAAAGVHPFEHGPMDPIVALVVDLENPEDAIAETLKVINREAQGRPDYDHTRAWVKSWPGGLDLRTRTGRLSLEAVLHHVQPDLLCLGPVYKMYRAGRGESDEQAAGQAQAVLDDLRTRYGFALVLEHHAPKGAMGTRDLLPHGTALWLRWPELGLKLVRDEDDPSMSLRVGRWRQDRVKCAWPVGLVRDRTWPWRGIYDARQFEAHRTAAMQQRTMFPTLRVAS